MIKRVLAIGMIAAYLTALGWGLVSHTFQVGTNSHVGMYFVVWDMFCGWGAYAQRLHVIGEAEDGGFYELSPGPWGKVAVFSSLDRHHYDSTGQHLHRLATNTLRNTNHPPLTQLYYIEEVWPKKFNLPDHLWSLRHEEPKDRQPYFHVRAVSSVDGRILQYSPNWHVVEATQSISKNPRLQADAHKSRPYYNVHMMGRGDRTDGGFDFTPISDLSNMTLLGN